MDDLDRKIVAALQIDPRASYRAIAAAAETTEPTVARRLQQLRADGTVRITGVVNPQATGDGQPVLIRARCRPGRARAVATSLAAWPDIRFLIGTTGRFDLLIEMITQSPEHLAQALSADLGEIDDILETTSELVLETHKTAYDWSRGLLDAGAAQKLRDAAPAREPMSSVAAMDPEDVRLAVALADDGRATYAELAERAELSESTARRRVDALVRRGALILAVFVAPAEMGYATQSTFHARVQPSAHEAAVAHLAALPEIRYLSSTYTLGRLTGEVVAGDAAAVADFSRRAFAELEGLVELDMAVTLETYKRAYVLTGPAAAARANAGGQS